MTRKIISLFLCAAFAAGSLSILSSCADGNSSSTSGAAGTAPGVANDQVSKTDGVDFASLFADLSDEERTINIAYVEGGNGTFTEHSLVVDELNMDPTDGVDLAVQQRNLTVEQILGVTLTATKVAEGFGELAAAVEQDILGNFGYWDVLGGYQYFSIGMAKKGLLLNLADLGNVGVDGINADYITLENSYWGTAYNDALSYNGAYYWITGDIALRYMGGMYCTFVNSDIYAAKLQETYDSIYQIAKDGKWTLDKMSEMAALCAVDDGDDVRGDTDTYGIGYEVSDVMDGIAFASNVQFSKKDPDTGAIKLVIDSDHTNEFAAKVYNTVTGGAKAYSYNYGNADSTLVMPKFAEGKLAFTVNKVFQSQVYLNEVKNFYVIPAPKLNDEQKTYVTGIHDGVTIFGIPVDCQKVPQTAATLELLAKYSEEYVKPAYYEAALKTSYVRDPEAAEMIDLIHDNVNTDFVAAWSESLGNIVHIFRTDAELSKSKIARNKPTWQKSIDELCEALDAAADNSAV